MIWEGVTLAQVTEYVTEQVRLPAKMDITLSDILIVLPVLSEQLATNKRIVSLVMKAIIKQITTSALVVRPVAKHVLMFQDPVQLVLTAIIWKTANAFWRKQSIRVRHA